MSNIEDSQSAESMQNAPDWQANGVTLRDFFAVHAPEPPKEWRGGARKLRDLIEWRWHYADEMLKARSPKETQRPRSLVPADPCDVLRRIAT